MTRRGPKILLVDDSTLQLEAMAFVANQHLPGNVTVTSSPTAAALIAKKLRPEIVITDFNLNHTIDGIQLVRNLIEVCPRTLFVVRTLTPDEVTQIDGIQIWDKRDDFETTLEHFLTLHFGAEYRDSFNDSGESVLH